MAAALKLLPLFTLVMPGMAARILFKNEVPKYCGILGMLFIGYFQYNELNESLVQSLIKILYFLLQVGCSSPERCKEFCAIESGCSNKAYILLVLKVLPHGKMNNIDLMMYYFVAK